MKKDLFNYSFFRFHFVLFVLIIIYPVTLSAGWLIVEKKEDRFGNFSMQSLFIEQQKVRIENPTSTFIFDLSKENVTLIFHQQLVYWSGSAALLKDEFIASIEQQIVVMMEQMPQQERDKAKIEFDQLLLEMRKGAADSLVLNRFSVMQSDSVSEILGHKARQHFIMVDTTVIEEVWISDEIQPYQSISFEKLTAMMQLFSRPNVLSAARQSRAWEQAIKNGIVLRSVIKTPFGKNVMEVAQLRETPIRAEVFLPPDAYRKVIATEAIAIMMGDDAIVSPKSAAEDEWKPMLSPVKPNTSPSIFPPKNEEISPY